MATRCPHDIATSAGVMCVNCMDIDPHAACRAEVVALRERAGRQQARHIHELMVQEDAIIALQADHAEASARVALLEGLLHEVMERAGECPICEQPCPELLVSHRPDCRLVAALAARPAPAAAPREGELEAFIARLLKSHLALEGLVCQEFGGDTTDSDALAAEWAVLRADAGGERTSTDGRSARTGPCPGRAGPGPADLGACPLD